VGTVTVESFEPAELPWLQAMETALYGPRGFYSNAAPKDHFRTSSLASDLFAAALLRLVLDTDESLGRPDPLDVVDVGAGRGELLCRLSELAPPGLGGRLRLCAVERAPRPADLPAHIGWTHRTPTQRTLTGVLLATEWLDNVPLDLAEVDDAGIARYVLVDPSSGTEILGEPISVADAAWARRWYGEMPWPTRTRLELGAPRDTAWAAAVAALRHGFAITVDYGHTRDTRPSHGTLTAFRTGRQVAPVPDGSCDLTVHVAIDAVRAAGEAVAGMAAQLTTQREALIALGMDRSRPPLDRAGSDPVGYLRELSAATQTAELIASDGLGGHFWLLQPVGVNKGTLIGTTR
jgi:SAM-dependent MidA family methyltransferase